jgi:hypothetical protein
MDNRAMGSGNKQAATGACKTCLGTKRVVVKGVSVPCISCRGTGQQPGPYSTK